MVDNGSEFKQDFTPFLKYFYIKPVLTTIKNPQANNPAEWFNQVILNMLVTKDLANNFFDYIDPLGENLAYIAWQIRYYCHHNIMAKPGKSTFGRDMVSNLASVLV